MTLCKTQIEKLKNHGFKRYEISHLKAGRLDKISKASLKEMKLLLGDKKCRNNKPFIISADGIELRKSSNIIILKE